MANIPFTTMHGMFVPIDDEQCWRYFFVAQPPANPRGYGGDNLFAVAPFTTPFTGGNPPSITPRLYTADNDYGIDREVQADDAAKALAERKEPPALSGDEDYRSIRSAEKILEPGEDWRVLGTDDDPVVQEALGLAPTD